MLRKKRTEKLREDVVNIEREIEFLKANFRHSIESSKFMRALQGERSYIVRQIQITSQSQKEREEDRQERLAVANKNRTEKMKRSWRYFGAIRKNYYPDKSTKKIRSEHSKRRRGLDSDIPDVVWRNPSP